MVAFNNLGEKCIATFKSLEEFFMRDIDVESYYVLTYVCFLSGTYLLRLKLNKL